MKNLVFVAALAVASSAQASGFAFDNQSARAMAMGNAFASVADEPSAVYYNPAGLLAGDGLSLQIGGDLIFPSLHFTAPSGEVTGAEHEVSAPPHLYAKWIPVDRFAVGLGVYQPFGLNLSWPSGWVGSDVATRSELSTWAFEPAVALYAHPKIRVGAGLTAVNTRVLFENTRRSLDVEGWGVGVNLGAHLEIIKDAFEVSASWRSGVETTLEGTALLDSAAHGLETKLRLPDTIYAGFSTRPVKPLLLAFEAHWVSWSQLRSFNLHFDDPTLNTTIEKLWRDTWSVNAGGEYAVSDQLQLRAGLTWEPNPSPQATLAPDLPALTRWRMAVGAGYAVGDLRLDAGYELALLQEIESGYAPLTGRYGGVAHTVALTIGYHLPGHPVTSDTTVW